MHSHDSFKRLSSSPETSPKTTLLTQVEAAAFLGIAPATLSVWRCTKRYALPFVKVGRLVRYSEADLISFLESRRVQGI